MAFLINFYRDTFKRRFIRPVSVFLSEVNTPVELLKTIVYFAALIYLLGFHPSQQLMAIIGLLIGGMAWFGGNFLIKNRIPHIQNEINNELNPQIRSLTEILERIKNIEEKLKNNGLK